MSPKLGALALLEAKPGKGEDLGGPVSQVAEAHLLHPTSALSTSWR
jgi:hypothetical protein